MNLQKLKEQYELYETLKEKNQESISSYQSSIYHRLERTEVKNSEKYSISTFFRNMNKYPKMFKGITDIEITDEMAIQIMGKINHYRSIKKVSFRPNGIFVLENNMQIPKKIDNVRSYNYDETIIYLNYLLNTKKVISAKNINNIDAFNNFAQSINYFVELQKLNKEEQELRDRLFAFKIDDTKTLTVDSYSLGRCDVRLWENNQEELKQEIELRLINIFQITKKQKNLYKQLDETINYFKIFVDL